MILNCTDWKLFQIKLQFETLNVLKAGGGGGGHLKAVLTSLNTAFLPMSRSRFKRH